MASPLPRGFRSSTSRTIFRHKGMAVYRSISCSRIARPARLLLSFTAEEANKGHSPLERHILTIIGRRLYYAFTAMREPNSDDELSTNTDVIQGTLDLLILKTLSIQPMHAFGIARRVEQISRGVFKVNPGSLLTALQRLERAGSLDSEWSETPNSRRAKFYKLTRTGRKQLEVETADWTRRASAVARLLKAEG